MKKIFLSLLMTVCATTSVCGQQSKDILDKAAEAFRAAGGIEATFRVKTYNDKQPENTTEGVIRLKGEKFMLKTPDVQTWFDGTTQWTYLTGSGEVNVSNPTKKELQSINPYSFLYLYRNGYTHKAGKAKRFQGKAVTEVILTATDRKQEFGAILLYLTNDTCQPVFILLQEWGGKRRSEITVTDYRTGKHYADNEFVFERSQYPNVEIIDLR